MGLNWHTSSDESRGNLGAELRYDIWSSISSGETANSGFCSENFGFGLKSEILVSPEEMLGHMYNFSHAQRAYLVKRLDFFVVVEITRRHRVM